MKTFHYFDSKEKLLSKLRLCKLKEAESALNNFPSGNNNTGRLDAACQDCQDNEDCNA